MRASVAILFAAIAGAYAHADVAGYVDSVTTDGDVNANERIDNDNGNVPVNSRVIPGHGYNISTIIPQPRTSTLTDTLTSTYCPICTSTSENGLFTTVYTTVYSSVCSTGIIPVTYTVTQTCPETCIAGPTAPPGFTSSTAVYTAGPTPVTTVVTYCTACATNTATAAAIGTANTVSVVPAATSIKPFTGAGSTNSLDIILGAAGAVFAGAMMWL